MLKPILYSTIARKAFEAFKNFPVIGGPLIRFANTYSFSYLDNTKKKLDKISPSFCSAKWLQSTIHLGAGQTHSCCLSPRHFINPEDLKNKPSALHNTKEKIEARQALIAGKQPAECDSCWKIEESNKYSERLYRSAEIWAAVNLKDLTEDRVVRTVNPSFLELSFSSVCNLRCSYCDPMVSSAISSEIKKYGPYPTTNAFQNLNEFEESKKRSDKMPEQFVEYFWQWWPTLKKDLKVLRVTGGEPLLSPDLFKLLGKFREEDLHYLDFIVNSNLMVNHGDVLRFIGEVKTLVDTKRMKSFHLFTSVDTWGKHAEFLRWD